ncbi:triphosphoribosyl-dephospho-CoA synthase [Paucibacter sp. R3-3]|uniref:triphosphoribosyl-dephospho-CoA synthase n=1 Tax=Roseateles agri TaxID=3098619 RepID=A0ABU5DK55_9BURK|nr:triphosphoribosyl-dephospho-CoA synthase [Paucibacter sp. R3-3]MDY0746672.1 triphosphoribosyl-dephospho-CoA synthase [Paucibacter sp. R3-3]
MIGAASLVARRRLSPQQIGRAATLALHDELALAPKPGLVTLTSRGSHEDMDAHTFMRSLFSLRSYFVRIATLGREHAPFEALERCGIEAEQRMLAATGGINTHRGAIFMLGLLCAAIGANAQDPRAALLGLWGEALRARSSERRSTLPGGIAARRYGLRSASEEAALGFPVLFETALPALREGPSRLHALFRIIAVLDDSNLARRGGLEGLRFAQAQARRFLADGRIETAEAIGREFVHRRLSPGGAADTLAAACLLVRLGIG